MHRGCTTSILKIEAFGHQGVANHSREIKHPTDLWKMGNRGVSKSNDDDYESSRRNGGFSTPPTHGFNGLGLDFEVGCSWKMVWGSLHISSDGDYNGDSRYRRRKKTRRRRERRERCRGMKLVF